MDVGAINAGCTIVAASELDPHACNTFRENHKKTTLIEGDLDQNMDKVCSFEDIDIVIGGPPCQGFSVAGKMDANDPRSKLVFSFCEVVERVKPTAFIMENVKALGTLTKFQNVRDEIVRRMTKSGYNVSMSLLNAKDFGVPQSRERVFIIGTRKSHSKFHADFFEKYREEAISLRSAISHLGRAGSKNNPNKTNAKITLAANPVLRKSPYAGMLFNGQGRPINPDSWSSTLPASMGGNRTPIVDEDHLYNDKPSWVEQYHKNISSRDEKVEYKDAPKRLRRLTIDEAAIIQTFPKEYVFIGPQTRVFSQIGNAVPCKLAETVINSVLDCLNQDPKMKRTARVRRNDNYQLDI